jgi:hypothetical protein
VYRTSGFYKILGSSSAAANLGAPDFSPPCSQRGFQITPQYQILIRILWETEMLLQVGTDEICMKYVAFGPQVNYTDCAAAAVRRN